MSRKSLEEDSVNSESCSVELQCRSYPSYQKYKHSAIAWLGEIPAHWKVAPVNQVYAIQLGKMLQNAPATSHDMEVPYLKAQHVQWFRVDTKDAPTMWASPSDVARFGLSKGDLLVCEGGEGGRCGILNDAADGFIIQNALHRVRPREPGTKIHNDFLQYMMSSIATAGWLNALNEKATIAHFTRDKFASLRVPIPPPEEQRAIVAFLDRKTAKIDALVAKKERLIELLQEKRVTLITRAVTKGLDPAVPVKASGVEWLGAIPKHWKLRRLKRLSKEITVGVVVNPSTYVCDEGVPFVYGSDIQDGRITPDTARRISKENSEALRKSQLSTGDLLTVRVGAPGVTAVVPPELEGANCASVVIIRKDKSFDSGWLCHAMNSRVVRYQIELVQYGAAQEQFNVAHAVDFLVPQPTLDEQRTLAAFLDHHTMKTDALLYDIRRAIDRLKELRNTLISVAVTGKIDVRDETTANPEPTS